MTLLELGQMTLVVGATYWVEAEGSRWAGSYLGDRMGEFIFAAADGRKVVTAEEMQSIRKLDEDEQTLAVLIAGG